MDRRAFIASLAGGLAAPLAAEAQQAGRVYRVGLLHQGSSRGGLIYRTLSGALGELGWIEGKNIVIEARYAEGHTEKLPELAVDLVRLNADVIVTNTNPETLAAQQATASIPIVMLFGLDPVGTRLIASYARPGGNVTGVVWAMPETAAKTVQLLKEMVPTARKAAVIYDPTVLGIESYMVTNEGTARALGMTLQRVEVRGPEDFEVAFSTILKGRTDALWVGTTGVVGSRIAEIIDFAARRRLPAIYPSRWVVDYGGLMSYGAKYTEVFRRAAFYVDRLLRGAKPADLPVEQPSKFELIINLNTAKALGLTVPLSLLQRADQVIE